MISGNDPSGTDDIDASPPPVASSSGISNSFSEVDALKYKSGYTTAYVTLLGATSPKQFSVRLDCRPLLLAASNCNAPPGTSRIVKVAKVACRPGYEDLERRLIEHLSGLDLELFDKLCYLKWLLSMVNVFRSDFDTPEEAHDMAQELRDAIRKEEEVDVSLRVDCATGQIFYRFYHGAVKTDTFAAETMYDYLTPLQQAIGQELSSIEDVEQLLGIKYSSSTGSSDKQRPLTAEEEESSAAIFMTYIVGRLRQSWSKPVEVKKVLSLFDDVRTIAEGSWEPSLAKHKSGGTQLSYAGYRRQYGKRNRQAGKSKCCTSLV